MFGYRLAINKDAKHEKPVRLCKEEEFLQNPLYLKLQEVTSQYEQINNYSENHRFLHIAREDENTQIAKKFIRNFDWVFE